MLMISAYSFREESTGFHRKERCGLREKVAALNDTLTSGVMTSGADPEFWKGGGGG